MSSGLFTYESLDANSSNLRNFSSQKMVLSYTKDGKDLMKVLQEVVAASLCEIAFLTSIKSSQPVEAITTREP